MKIRSTALARLVLLEALGMGPVVACLPSVSYVDAQNVEKFEALVTAHFGTDLRDRPELRAAFYHLAVGDGLMTPEEWDLVWDSELWLGAIDDVTGALAPERATNTERTAVDLGSDIAGGVELGTGEEP
jgi:hypothetical protein